MAKEIRLNAFEMNCVAHQSPGLWRHPRDRSRDYKRLDYWIELAQILERGLFDGLFLADVLGVYDVFGGDERAALAHGAQTPVNDPLLLVPAMAAATRNLGFGVTVNLSYEPPYGFARRMSTLDHLTEGRIGWNIVTGYLDSAAKGAGKERQTDHDDRYAIAEEYMEVVYKLWEGSWDDSAVKADGGSGIFADPDRVRKVKHQGAHFRVDAVHLSEPSPQRTPVLYQAGSSPAGRTFAGRHAECVFISGPSKAVIAPRVAAIREGVAKAGRDPASILIFALLTVIVAPTDAEAQAKIVDYRRYADLEGALTLMSGWTGIDFSKLDPDQIVQHVENQAGRTALENITRADPHRSWTVRQVAEHVSIGGIGPVIVGSPSTVADELEAWVDETDVDGFNLAFAVRPETFEDVSNLLVPELQRRGRYKKAYRPGTLREKLFNGPARLQQPHFAARFR
ncbi:LLM class flavin-dependent oxidoreductase [Methylocapsa sp. S129]|uniref:LLM class flavin-dependent oxidoreductase n=1 Tax=Methylocapsa sp. S129 TaxID=1641869 RepID=UPI00131B1A57|nr:LLM class flavin-dependent oxidoreductase [Methylocapsa sp. S129]